MGIDDDYADLGDIFWEFIQEFGKVMHDRVDIIHNFLMANGTKRFSIFNERNRYEKVRDHITSLSDHLKKALLDVKEMRELTKEV